MPSQYTLRGVGDYPLAFSSDEYLGRMGNVPGTSMHLDNADVAVKMCRLGYDVWLRHWADNMDWDPAYIVSHMPYVPDDVRGKIGFVINNEGDWGFGRRANESTLDWYKRTSEKYIAVMALAYAQGWRRFSVLNMSMGNPDITNFDDREGIRIYFKPLYNNQTVSGDPEDSRKVEIYFDWHAYVPNLTWLWDDGKVPLQVLDASDRRFDIDTVESFRTPPNLRWGEPAKFMSAWNKRSGQYVTWMEPDPEGNKEYFGVLPPSGRIIHPANWFCGRFLFCFWPEMGIGLDHRIHRFRASEGIFDEGGWGGAPAHHYNALQVNQGVVRFNEIMYAPVELESGIFVPSPYTTVNFFCTTDQDPKWSAGFSVAYAIRDPVINVQNWMVR